MGAISSSPLFSLQTAVTPAWTEDLLKRFLLAEDIIIVHFHLFSSRSKSSRKVLHPRMLNSDTLLLENSAKYFADLFSLETIPSDSQMVVVETSDAIFDGLPLDEYGYESDSDLEDEQDESDDKDDDEDSDGDDGYDPSCDVKKNSCAVSGLNSKKLDMEIVKASATSAESDKGRHIFVKDTAFQTWYCLLYYLYTGAISFAPLRSSGGQRGSLNANKRPQCSAKSMYALATKLGLGQLREQAFAFLRKNLNERNLLEELACSFAGRYPDVLELELDLLAEKFATVPIIQGFPHLMTRIAKNELDHGAKILIGHHTRILQKYSLSTPFSPTATSSLAHPTMAISSTQPALTASSSQPIPPPPPGTPFLLSFPSTAPSASAPPSFSFLVQKTSSPLSNPGKSK
ncbi:hypothetical protein EDD17DRAFT_1538845 [Pisolithus thermaeus]|nr:hypothetical protein EV401DRAFT_1937339 [Pisolithus croceorrhizus]KAI6167564.1 hypothetical protein EDD17DRAFT_1538845 [Pisolithus thermaeus]